MCNGIIHKQAARDQVPPPSCSQLWRAGRYASFRFRGRFILERQRRELMSHSSQEVENFYTTWTWRKCRKAFAESKGNICERCRKRGIIEPGSKDRPLEVHHKIPLTADNYTDPKVSLNWENLELLCKSCHDEERERRAKRWTIGPEGRVIL